VLLSRAALVLGMRMPDGPKFGGQRGIAGRMRLKGTEHEARLRSRATCVSRQAATFDSSAI